MADQPIEQTSAKPKSKFQLEGKTLYFVIAVAILVLIGGFISFKKGIFKSKQEASPSPQASSTLSPSPSESPQEGAGPTPTKKPSPTPTPKSSPSPTSSPTPTPSPVAFAVTSASASVSPTNYSGSSCPKEFDFNANITANGAGTVTYKWVRSDGGTGPDQTINFSSAGTQAASQNTWTFGGPGTSYSGWEKVQISSPNSTESNQANFTLNCT